MNDIFDAELETAIENGATLGNVESSQDESNIAKAWEIGREILRGLDKVKERSGRLYKKPPSLRGRSMPGKRVFDYEAMENPEVRGIVIGLPFNRGDKASAITIDGSVDGLKCMMDINTPMEAFSEEYPLTTEPERREAAITIVGKVARIASRQGFAL